VERQLRGLGARKLWKAARRAGHDIDRDQVTRLMPFAGIEGSVAPNGSAPRGRLLGRHGTPIWSGATSPRPPLTTCGSLI
jgi:hypothetical protein